MKAIFKKIGQVNTAELELKDLTIIAGDNNTGKTYLAYTLYGFLKSIQQQSFLKQKHMLKDLPFDLDNTAREIIDSGNVQCIVKNFDKKAKKIIRKLFKISSDSISEIFSSPPDDFKDAELSVSPEYLFNKKRENTVNVQTGTKVKYNITALLEEDILSFNLQNYKSIPHQDPNLIKDLLISTFIGLCVPIHPDPFILSAERFGISVFYKELDFTKNRVVEILQKLKDKGGTKKIDPFFLLMDQTSSRYAQPIKDNIDYTRDLESIQKQNSPLFDNKLFDHIKGMLNGYFKYRDNEIRFISKARKSGKFDIPLHLASSSARGMSDLYFFLKHIAHKNHLLIIDEPESHLNTANQIKMAQLLARCVNSGLKVLITTHSDYLIKEFNNLIMLSNNFNGKDDFLKSNKQYTLNDYLNPESVGAYICEKGSLTSCHIDERGMDIRVFDDTIDAINQISDELDFLID